MSDGEQRSGGGRRGWWLVGLLAISGGVVGALAGNALDPEVDELMFSVGVVGFGLGGLLGLLLLAPVGIWRAWRRRAASKAVAEPAPPEPVEEPPPAPEPQDDPEPEPEAEAPQEASPERPPPPGGEPGWYPDPAREGVRHYWDGQSWTGNVWRERARKARSRGSS